MESQTGISEQSCQAVLEPRLGVRVQPQTEAAEVGQGSALQAVNIHVRGEQEDSKTDKDVGH